MRIFESDGSINFVDENNVLVGFDYGKNYCENFGYYFTNKKPEKIDDDVIPENSFSHIGYVFDKSICEEVPKDEYSEGGGAIYFKLTKGGERDVFLVLYNWHNGYYSHGFEMKDGKNKTLRSGNL